MDIVYKRPPTMSEVSNGNKDNSMVTHGYPPSETTTTSAEVGQLNANDNKESESNKETSGPNQQPPTIIVIQQPPPHSFMQSPLYGTSYRVICAFSRLF